MRRHVSLRQIEAFKAVIEHGTVNRAAVVMRVSQPAISKMIANLEADAELRLFDRFKGRLAPTEHGMRLYDEVDRIFNGVRQIENAIDAIRRENRSRLTVGVMPALSGQFIQAATSRFLERHPEAFCTIESRSSQRIAEWLMSRKLDVGLVSSDVENPYLVSESILSQPLVCIMPPGHELAQKRVIKPSHLDHKAYVSFDPETRAGRPIALLIAEHQIEPNITLIAKAAQTLCEFVSAGHGISLVHPVVAKEFENRLVVRPFSPDTVQDFRICRSKEGRNARVIADFVAAARETAKTFF